MQIFQWYDDEVGEDDGTDVTFIDDEEEDDELWKKFANQYVHQQFIMWLCDYDEIDERVEFVVIYLDVLHRF